MRREGGHPGGKTLGGADLAGGGGRVVHTWLSVLLDHPHGRDSQPGKDSVCVRHALDLRFSSL